jgi:purine-nucleoside phosphorylase
MSNIPTPHIEATSKDEVAKVVLMPGDPLRAKKIAETYLKDAKLFNQVRGMLGYTGFYNGKRVSVMGSGMGFGSIGIYSYELFKFYDANTIIRIGSCGASRPDMKVMDIVLTDRAFSTETFAKEAHGYDDKLIPGSQRVSDIIKKVAADRKIKMHVGNVASGSVFYSTVREDYSNIEEENGIIAAEMEAFALFANAKALNKEAACLLTVSDSKYDQNNNLTAEARQNAFNEMMVLALESAAASLD